MPNLASELTIDPCYDDRQPPRKRWFAEIRVTDTGKLVTRTPFRPSRGAAEAKAAEIIADLEVAAAQGESLGLLTYSR